ncbi:MAG: ABC transporter ATP-binding protein [Anaerolineae bacterium]
MLEVENLSKQFGSHIAVDGVSFTVERGEVFGLLGPNGAGKTTAISMLTGVLEPSGGTARIGGHDIRTDMAQAKKLNGLVPQDLALYPTLSARANLNFFGQIYGLNGKALRERVDDVLRIVSLAERADETIETYSGGMKRRINIAAGLVHQPELLFLDEPTVGVDPQSRNAIFDSVQQLNRSRGMSIIYTSHYMEEVELLCDRAAIIDQGKIIALDTIKNLVGLLGGGMIHLGLARTDPDLLAALGALPGVNSVQVVPPTPAEEAMAREGRGDGSTQVRVTADHARDALVGVIGLLNARDVDLTALEILEPNLESVFLHLTGKKLRE